MTAAGGIPARTRRYLVRAWLAATILSVLPSTLYALATGGDAGAGVRAAGSMMLPYETDLIPLLVAAAIVHPIVSLFWSLLLWRALPQRGLLIWALLAALGIAIVDLKLIAPIFFPQVAALPFGPQLADHLMWGASFGVALQRSFSIARTS